MTTDDCEATVAAARRLIELKAPLGPQWPHLAGQMMRWKELTLALSAMDLWHEQVAAAEAAAFQKASFLSQSGASERAARLLRTVPKAFPSPVVHAYFKATVLLSLGRTDDAEAAYRSVLALDHQSGRAWQGLAQLSRITDVDLERMKTIAGAGHFRDRVEEASFHHAMGVAWEKRKNIEETASQFKRVQQILAHDNEYNGADEADSVAISQTWKNEQITDLAEAAPKDSRKPVFVTGLPRSGTTLVQQILSAHSAVDGGREFGLAVPIEAVVGGFSARDFNKYLNAGKTIAALRERYLRLVHERLPGDGMFVDKTLHQSRSLGPFSVIFPDAPVIWMRRDPMDQAWSLIRTWLGPAIASWTQEDLAHHMKLEDAMHAFWQRELGDRLLTVPYRSLVEHPSEWIVRITNHCGLNPEDGQTRFYDTSESVNTASALQVREPINLKGLGIAEPYRPFLAPFVEAYFGR